MFLAEAYGMSRRPDLRKHLAKAVKLIVTTQNRDGGWRYQPQRQDADISVTVCQIMALRAARNAGLFVPHETIEAAVNFVKRWSCVFSLGRHNYSCRISQVCTC